MMVLLGPRRLLLARLGLVCFGDEACRCRCLRPLNAIAIECLRSSLGSLGVSRELGELNAGIFLYIPPNLPGLQAV